MSGARDPIAIVGIGCRFPRANTPDELWELLAGGVDAVSEVPPARWLPELYGAGMRWGGFLADIAGFDYEFFGIARREAESMDVQQRLLLEVAWRALEDAGMSVSTLRGRRVGSFVGITSHDYAELAWEKTSGDPLSATGQSNSIAANRLSYWFGWTGPSLAVDTACSSSLVALHLACRSIWAGESELALAGGVNALLSPRVAANMAKAGLISTTGRCRAFAKGADGFVRGEGAGLVVLKPLAKALADGERIHALILGSAMNHGGRSNGLTAPSLAAQRTLLRDAYADAGIEPRSVHYVEAHGTGTPIGDALESKALGEVLGRERAASDACWIGSIKTNIGHLEAASGVASLAKVALSLARGVVPATLHHEAPMSDAFDALGLKVVTRTSTWPAHTTPARAGVSAFGMGGTNAHLVLEEPPPDDDRTPLHRAAEPPEESALLLSARDAEALGALARAYARLLATPSLAPPARAVCHASALRRTHHKERLALVGRSSAELAAHLAAFLAADDDGGWWRGRAISSRPPPPIAFEGSDARGRARHWALGGEADWTPVYGAGPCPHVPLPEYPLRPVRCWFEAETPTLVPAPELPVAAKDPTPVCIARSDARAQTPPLTRTVDGVLEWLLGWFVEHVGREAESVGGSGSLADLGFNSLHAVALTVDVEAWLGRPVEPAIFWAHPTIRGLSLALVTEEARPVTAAADARSAPAPKPLAPSARMQFSLLYFSSNAEEAAENRYKLVMDSAAWADQRGFAGLWIPERHFHPFGGLFPNPAIVAAALARSTAQIRLRAGSVVMPLHSPLRVAEEWSVVDNLSGGRVDLAFATGWNPNDFVLAPGTHAERAARTAEGLKLVQRLWRGESLTLPNGRGEPATVRVFPRPLQAELPTWITSNGDPARFVEAGASGANILTALLFQSVEELGEKLRLYREARAAHGFDPRTGVVTLMLHTFLGSDIDAVRQKVRAPLTEYLRSSVSLWKAGEAKLESLDEREQQTMLDYAFERYFQQSGLFGTPESCRSRVAELAAVGVDEIASLIDFGVDTRSVMGGLEALDMLRAEGARAPQERDRAGQGPSLSLPVHSDRPPRIVLDPSIAQVYGGGGGDEQATFVTGATGFVGSALVRDLLHATAGTIYCLVRARDDAAAEQRLRRAMEPYPTCRSEIGHRILAVRGELGRPRLGLATSTYDALARDVGAIYHAGALVSFGLPYAALEGPNVRGSEEVLRLAACGRLKRLHHISSDAVFHTMDRRAGRLDETALLPAAADELVTAYGATKWAAERLAEQGRARGIPVAIYRTGWITGDSVTGVSNRADFLGRIIRGGIEMRCLPDHDVPLCLTAIDDVSRAVVYLSSRPELAHGTFHVANPADVTWRDLVAGIGVAGYEVELLPFEAWRKRLEDLGAAKEVLAPLLPLLLSGPRAGVRLAEMYRLDNAPRLDARLTAPLLAQGGIRFSPPNESSIARYVRALLEAAPAPSSARKKYAPSDLDVEGASDS